MSPEQQADIRDRTTAVGGLVFTLQAELLMIGVYQEMDDEAGAIGARQAACAAMTKIESNLTVLKGYCQ
jgi:hypothetical protein